MKKILVSAVVALSLATGLIAQTVPNYVPTNGLVGWWPFNGNANDESGNGNNGTVHGATLTTDRYGISNKEKHLLNMEIVMCKDQKKGFKVLPKKKLEFKSF